MKSGQGVVVDVPGSFTRTWSWNSFTLFELIRSAATSATGEFRFQILESHINPVAVVIKKATALALLQFSVAYRPKLSHIVFNPCADNIHMLF
jgi:hypothetical protein